MSGEIIEENGYTYTLELSGSYSIQCPITGRLIHAVCAALIFADTGDPLFREEIGYTPTPETYAISVVLDGCGDCTSAANTQEGVSPVLISNLNIDHPFFNCYGDPGYALNRLFPLSESIVSRIKNSQ